MEVPPSTTHARAHDEIARSQAETEYAGLIVAVPQVVSAKCPSCGANLPVPPGMLQLMCRYCQNVIQVEHRKPPPEMLPFGTPGGLPSRTLYLDPEGAKAAGKKIGCIVAAAVLLPILLPIAIGVGPWAFKSCKGAVKPFPVDCSLNESIEVSGNFEGTGPIVTSVGHNCKLHITNSKLKGSTLLKSDAANLELTLENVTIETTDTMIKAGSNVKAKIHGSTLTSAVSVFDTDSNLELVEFESSTIESKTGSALKTKYNLKIHAENAKLRGKKAAIDADANLELSLKKGSEVTSSDGVGIKTTSGFKLEADGGKIDGPEGAIVSTSGMRIDAHALTLSASKESAIATTSGLKLDFTEGSIIAQAESAIAGDGGELTLVNTKIQGVDAGLNLKNGLKLKASKKTRIVGTTGFGILVTSNADITLNDAAVEGASKAFKGGVNTKMKLGQGARVAGKRGGIETDSNLELDGTGASIDGGTGPGLMAGSNARIAFRQGALKGTPALQTDRRPSSLDLEGTRVDGDQKTTTR
jgi:hypothetical protein